MTKDQRQDETDPLPARLAETRRAYRGSTTAALRRIAGRLVDGTIDADEARRDIAKATQEYTQNYPDIVAEDKTPARFPKDFSIRKQNYEPDPEETKFLERIDEVLNKLSDDQADDKTRYSEARFDARQECRKQAAITLRKEFEEFRKKAVIATKATDNVLVTQGIYIAKRDRLKLPLFEVKLILESDPKKPSRAVSIEIRVREGLPPPDDQPSQEKRELFVQVNRAWTVIDTVCLNIRERATIMENRRWSKGRADRERERADQIVDEYIRKLHNVAVNGLEGSHTELASAALRELRAQFTAQQAGRIKNIYVRSLGIAAGVAAASLLALYAFITNYVGGWWYGHRSFLIAAAGAAIGSWLSFSIRRVTLSFEELGVLEDDLLDPSVRILFVIGLTLTACLLFWTEVMNIQVGDLKTNATEFMQTGSIAMLLGIFFGLSERVLATAISGRATTFVRGIGNG